MWRDEAEKSFYNAFNNKKEDWPSLNDDPQVSLSVIVPAYNEETRRKKFLSYV